jgi:hypothetical protein
MNVQQKGFAALNLNLFYRLIVFSSAQIGRRQQPRPNVGAIVV